MYLFWINLSSFCGCELELEFDCDIDCDDCDCDNDDDSNNKSFNSFFDDDEYISDMTISKIEIQHQIVPEYPYEQFPNHGLVEANMVYKRQLLTYYLTQPSQEQMKNYFST